jgi:hypothetical protein
MQAGGGVTNVVAQGIDVTSGGIQWDQQPRECEHSGRDESGGSHKTHRTLRRIGGRACVGRPPPS